MTPISSNRRRNHELSPQHRAQIYGAARYGVSVAEIANQENLPASTVKSVIKRVSLNGSTLSKPRNGRPKKYTDRSQRAIMRIIKSNPKITYAALLERLGSQFSKATIYRILKAHGVTNWRAKKRPLLTEQHAALRLAFARQYVLLTPEEWATWLFSDECSVEHRSRKPREWVFRTPAQKWQKEMIQAYQKGKGVSVMIWAAIYGENEKSELVIMRRDPESPRRGYSAASYCESLEEGLLPIYENNMIFMQDQAPIHRSNKAQRWLQEHSVILLRGWPPYSPDLNPIEHLWFAVKKALDDVCPEIDNIKGDNAVRAAMEDALLKAWRLIPTPVVRSCLQSMKDRLEAVIQA